VQPAARLRWNRCLSFGGALFRAELLGRREASVVLGACGLCFLIASLRARLRRGSNLVSISLAIFGHSYVSWVAVQSGALQRGQSGDLFLRAAFALFFCWRCSFRAFFVGLCRVFHSSFVSFLFAEEGRGVAGVGGGVGWGGRVGFGVVLVVSRQGWVSGDVAVSGGVLVVWWPQGDGRGWGKRSWVVAGWCVLASGVGKILYGARILSGAVVGPSVWGLLHFDW
jgi:hypothetical protein